jgi:hypothetical protein
LTIDDRRIFNIVNRRTSFVSRRSIADDESNPVCSITASETSENIPVGEEKVWKLIDDRRRTIDDRHIFKIVNRRTSFVSRRSIADDESNPVCLITASETSENIPVGKEKPCGK